MAQADGRKLGSELREALERGEDITLDFTGVRAVLSAFLNPAVGELYGTFPAEEVDRRVSAVTQSDVQQDSLERVRENARRYYHDPAYRAAQDAARDELFVN